jgi:hypothetical protein
MLDLNRFHCQGQAGHHPAVSLPGRPITVRRRTLVAGIEKAIAKLDTCPERHPIAQDETERPGMTLRRMLYGRRPGVFCILISVEGDTVTLHYVRHTLSNQPRQAARDRRTPRYVARRQPDGLFLVGT